MQNRNPANASIRGENEIRAAKNEDISPGNESIFEKTRDKEKVNRETGERNHERRQNNEPRDGANGKKGAETEERRRGHGHGKQRNGNTFRKNEDDRWRNLPWIKEEQGYREDGHNKKIKTKPQKWPVKRSGSDDKPETDKKEKIYSHKSLKKSHFEKRWRKN